VVDAGLLQGPLTQTSDFSPGAFRQRELAGMRQKQGLKVALKKSEVLLSSTLQQPWWSMLRLLTMIGDSSILGLVIPADAAGRLASLMEVPAAWNRCLNRGANLAKDLISRRR
jgi:hypothetical protein